MISQADRLDQQAKEQAQGVMGARLICNLEEQVRTATPMPVVAGPVAPRNGIAPTVAPEDADFVEKTKGSLFGPALRLKNESLIAFVGRTELSLDEIRRLPRRELERLIKIRAANRANEGVVAPVNTVRLPPAPAQLPPNVIDSETIGSADLKYETYAPETI